MPAFPDCRPADSGAWRTSAVPARPGQPIATPWRKGDLWMVRRRPIALPATLQGTCAIGPELQKVERAATLEAKTGIIRPQGFCFASIGPRFSPFVVVLLPRKISTLFDSA